MIVTLHGSPSAPTQRTTHQVTNPGDRIDVKMAAILGFDDARAMIGMGGLDYATRPPLPTTHVVRFRLARTDPDGHRHYVFTGEIDP